MAPIHSNISAQPKCVLCSSTRLSDDSTASRILSLPEHSGRRVMRCSDCTLRLLTPYLSQAELDQLYAKEYFSEREGLGTSYSPSTGSHYRDVVDARLPKFDSTLKLLQRLHPSAKSLLDVGAGTGEFVAMARRIGIAAEGIELSMYAVQEASRRFGLLLLNERLESFVTDRRFDLVHLNHVFEHFPNPHLALDQIDSLVDDQGLVYVEVPYQFNCVERIKYRMGGVTFPFNLHSLHHPVFYTPKTLIRVFAAHGFVPLAVNLFDRVHYPIVDWWSSLKAIAWKGLSYLGQSFFIEAIFQRGHSK